MVQAVMVEVQIDPRTQPDGVIQPHPVHQPAVLLELQLLSVPVITPTCLAASWCIGWHRGRRMSAIACSVTA